MLELTLCSSYREDAATAEVSRSQLWQWVRHGIVTAEGKRVDKAYALKLLKEQTEQLAAKAPKGHKFALAAQYFQTQVTGEDYADFLTSYVPPLSHPSLGSNKLGGEEEPCNCDSANPNHSLLYNEITSAGTPSAASKL